MAASQATSAVPLRSITTRSCPRRPGVLTAHSSLCRGPPGLAGRASRRLVVLAGALAEAQRVDAVGARGDRRVHRVAVDADPDRAARQDAAGAPAAHDGAVVGGGGPAGATGSGAAVATDLGAADDVARVAAQQDRSVHLVAAHADADGGAGDDPASPAAPHDGRGGHVAAGHLLGRLADERDVVQGAAHHRHGGSVGGDGARDEQPTDDRAHTGGALGPDLHAVVSPLVCERGARNNHLGKFAEVLGLPAYPGDTHGLYERAQVPGCSVPALLGPVGATGADGGTRTAGSGAKPCHRGGESTAVRMPSLDKIGSTAVPSPRSDFTTASSLAAGKERTAARSLAA